MSLPPRRAEGEDPEVGRRRDAHMPLRHSAADLVADALLCVDGLTPQEVADRMSQGALLVDVREEDELRVVGWVRDSVWAPRGMLEFWADPSDRRHRSEFDPERLLILYCSTGERSALAGAVLRWMGYRDVYVLYGGIEAWKREGLPLESL